MLSFPIFKVIMLSVVMLSVDTLSVIILSIMAAKIIGALTVFVLFEKLIEITFCTIKFLQHLWH
jgi:hypothetical protein